MSADTRVLNINSIGDYTTTMILSSIVILYSILLLRSPAFNGPVSFDPALRHYILLGDLENLVHNVILLELAPPGWHIISYFLLSISPLDVIVTLNIFNILLISCGIISAYLCMSRIYSRNLGLLAAFLFPANYTFLDYSLRGDHYTLFAVTAVFITTSAVYTSSSNSIRGGTNIQLAIYSLLILVSGFVHYYSGILILVLWLAGSHVRKSSYQALIRWFLAHAPLCVGYILWLPKFYMQYQFYLQRFGVTRGGFERKIEVIFSPVDSITPIDISQFFPDSVLILIGIVLLILITASIVLIGSITAIDPQERIVILALFGATFGVFLIDFSTGSGGGRYALQAAALVPLGVVVGIKQLYRLEGRINKNLKNIVILLTVLVILFYSGGVLQYSVYGGDVSGNGEDLVKAADGVDTFIETTPEESVVLSTLHVSEGILKYYNTGSYEVHGIPQDTFNQHRMTNSTHTNQVYDENNEEHQRRLEHLVTNKKYVVVFTAYAYTEDRYGSVHRALVSRDFIPIKKSGSRWAGYVVFKKKT